MKANQCTLCGKEGSDRATCQIQGCKYSIFTTDKLHPETLSKYHDIPNVELRKIQQFKQKPNKKNRPMKKLLGALKRTLTGENKTGETLHGVLDLFPIPNQAIAKGLRALFTGDKREATEQFSKMLTLRNGLALFGSIAYFAGWITLDDLKSFVEFAVSLANPS